MKIRSLGDELFHFEGRADRQADMTKLIAVFRNFANAPKYVKAMTDTARHGCCTLHVRVLSYINKIIIGFLSENTV